MAQKCQSTSNPNLNEKYSVNVKLFITGQRRADCVVELIDDSDYEPTEEFRLVLGSPSSSTTRVAFVGKRNNTNIKIHNPEDGEY